MKTNLLKIFYLASGFLTFTNGIWMILFPFSWYTDFPGGASHTGAFNAHFIRDIGVTYLVAAFGFIWCEVNLKESRPVHLGLTAFFGGHALLHLADILAERLPFSHWLIDSPLVFAPAVVLGILAMPGVRKYIEESKTRN